MSARLLVTTGALGASKFNKSIGAAVVFDGRALVLLFGGLTKPELFYAGWKSSSLESAAFFFAFLTSFS
jgi:hypothetical protein